MKKTIFPLLLLAFCLMESCSLTPSEPHGTNCYFNVDDARFIKDGATQFQYDYSYKNDSITGIKIKDGTGAVVKDFSFKYNASAQLARIVNKLTSATEAEITYRTDRKWQAIKIGVNLIDSAFYDSEGTIEQVREYQNGTDLISVWQLIFEPGSNFGTPAGKNLKQVIKTEINTETLEQTVETIVYSYATNRDVNNLYHGFFDNLLARITDADTYMYITFSMFPTNYNLATSVTRTVVLPDQTETTTTETITYTFTSDLSLPIAIRVKQGVTSYEASWTNVCIQN